jgi:hypothetical protein
MVKITNSNEMARGVLEKGVQIKYGDWDQAIL